MAQKTDEEATGHVVAWFIQLTEWTDGTPTVRGSHYVLPHDVNATALHAAMVKLLEDHGGKAVTTPLPAGNERH